MTPTTSFAILARTVSTPIESLHKNSHRCLASGGAEKQGGRTAALFQMSFSGRGKSIHPMEARSFPAAPPLIVWMSIRLGIPWRVALQRSPPPLHQPAAHSEVMSYGRSSAFHRTATSVLTGCLTSGDKRTSSSPNAANPLYSLGIIADANYSRIRRRPFKKRTNASPHNRRQNDQMITGQLERAKSGITETFGSGRTSRLRHCDNKWPNLA
jgi:hypothetical protein